MSFWKDNSFLVTGGAGFLGSYVVDGLYARGATFVMVPRRDDYDLRHENVVSELLLSARPDIVIHLAANVGGIGANKRQPADFLYDNLIMGTHMMHQSYLAEVNKFVTVGTVCSYPKYTPVPFQEKHLWDGYPEETNAPYGLAKKMLLAQGQAYRNQYGFNSIHLLPANLYGPHDDFDPRTSHVIPAMIRKCLEAKQRNVPPVFWGTGSASREFLYVEDAAEGILLATEHYNMPEPVNLGTGQEIKIRELAHKIARLTDLQDDLIWDVTKPDGQPRRSLDITRAETFGFAARTTLDEGLKRTLAWYATEVAHAV